MIQSIDNHLASSLIVTQTLLTPSLANGAHKFTSSIVTNVFRTQVKKPTTTNLLHLIDMMTHSIKKNEQGDYEMPLPFKVGESVLPCNRMSAAVRAQSLKKNS